jgi:hypothetical protein
MPYCCFAQERKAGGEDRSAVQLAVTYNWPTVKKKRPVEVIMLVLADFA